MSDQRGRGIRRGAAGPSFGRPGRRFRGPDGAATPGAEAPARSTDPRVCRHCGERVLDMKYHLQHAHPRPARGAPQPPSDPAVKEALQQMASLLEQARDEVFKEPMRAMGLIDRCRDWVAHLRDPSKPRPGGRPATGAARAPAGKRVDMRNARPKKPGDDPGPW